MKKDQHSRLVFVLGGLNYGGAERVASHLLNYWYHDGWDLTLISRRGPANDFYEIPDDIERINLGGEGPSQNKLIALFRNLPFIWRLRQAIKESECEVVLSFLTKTNIHTILACIGLQKRVIISERNDTTRQDHPWPWATLREIVYRYADVVTANSEIAITGMQDYVPKEKLKMVPNPVFIPDEKAKPDQSQKLLNVGRLVPQKNQKLILEALANINPETLRGWTLDILGSGEEEEKLRDLAKAKDLEDQVILHGLVSDTGHYYSNASIFILSSVYEGTPNALLEAMSFGLPSIVSDSLPGALEIVDHGLNGLIFSSGNAEDLAKKIEILLHDPQLRSNMGAEAVESVKKYSPENVISIWELAIMG